MAFPASRSQARRDRYSRFLGSEHEVGSLAIATTVKWEGVDHEVGSLTGLQQFVGQSHDVGLVSFRQRYDSTEHEVGTCAFSTAPAVYANGYARRARIRVPASSIQFAGALPFAMLVAETDVKLKDAAHGGYVQSSVGRDIRFETTGGTKLPHILDPYDPATGKVVAWVRWPALTAGQNNDLYLYVGKAGLSASEADPAGASVDFLQWLNPRTGVDYTGQPGRSLTPTSIGSADLGLGDSADFDGTTSVASAAPWGGWGGWSAVALDVWVQADADAVGTSRSIYSQGLGTGSSGDMGIILHWRDKATAPQDQITNPMLFSVWGSISGQGSGFILTQANVQSSAKMHLCARWTNGQVPRISKDTVALAPAIKDDGSSFGVIGSGTVTVQPGSVWLGKGASTVDHPGGLWKGLMGPVRLRAADISDGQLKTEYANQLDPKSFYGIGGWDSVAESNNAPVAVPEPAFAVTQNVPTLLDVVADDYEPDGQNKTLLSCDTPSAGISSVAPSGGKALVTPAAGFVGDATFFYTVADVPGAGVTPKTSRGKVHATVGTDTTPVTDELPAPKRRILVPNDTVLTEVVRTSSPSFANATVQIVLAGTPSTPPIAAGDEIVLADGTYATARTISLKGTAANIIRFKAANKQKAIITNTWTLKETYKTLWGFKFSGVAARLIMWGQGNGALRCEFTGWGRGNCITGMSNAVTGNAGGEGQPGCFVWYCSMHDAAPWGAVGSGDPTTPINTWANVLRMGIRSNEDGADPVGTFPYNWHVKRCDFYNFNDKPVPTKYSTGQANVIEWAENGPSIAAAKLTASRSGGHVVAILTYLKAGLIFEDNVVRDCPEGSGTGAASVDFKCGGNIIRRLAMRNCPGRSDNRAGPFNVWEDISWENSRGMWSSGYGHQIRRTSGGITLTVTAGNIDAAGTAGTVSYGSPDGNTAVAFMDSQDCILEDINSPLVVGKDPTDPYVHLGVTYNDPLFKARNISVKHASPAPSGNAYPDSATRELCTYQTGAVVAPQDIPTNASVGINAPWVG